jgi:hypothetical protein
MLGDTEPTTVKEEQETPDEQDADEVATPYTPAPPFETRMFDDDGCVVVARPVQVTVEFVPPMREPIVPVIANGPEKE